MFGDHQPKLEDSFYELLYGKSLNSLSLKELQKKYTVPFIILANYDIDAKSDVENVSANYLSSLMLQQTNLSCLEIFHITAHRKNPQVLADDLQTLQRS